VVEVHKTRCVVELEGEAISILFEVLVEGLSLLSEKGLESEEEKREYQRVVDLADKLFETVRKTAILSPNYVQTLERLKRDLRRQQTTPSQR
jgi:hypothetical protein